MLVEVKGVTKAFKKQKVLSNVNFSIQQNEIFGLIGPSGSGKTTLIRLMIGAIEADQGEIHLQNYRIPDWEALNIIGYMPQNDALYADLSGYDNLMFFGGMYRMRKEELKQRAVEVLELVELTEHAAKKVQNYSGGMKKRLSLAVALLHRPQVLILDEPTVGIDPILRKKIWEEFYRLKEQGISIIVTTHVMDETSKCDRLALLHEGEIIACDTLEALLSRTQDRSQL